MRHLSVCLAGVLAAVVIGCGPGKELPDEVSAPREHQPPPADPGIKIPKVSDPDAKAFVDQAIKAFTQNNPDRLAKGKVSKSIATGSMKLHPSARGALSTCRPIALPGTLAGRGEGHRTNTRGIGRGEHLIMRGGVTMHFLNNERRPNRRPRGIEEICGPTRSPSIGCRSCSRWSSRGRWSSTCAREWGRRRPT